MKEEENNIDFDELVCQINENDMAEKEEKKLKLYVICSILLMIFTLFVMYLCEYPKISIELHFVFGLINFFSAYLLMKGKGIVDKDSGKEFVELLKELANESKWK